MSCFLVRAEPTILNELRLLVIERFYLEDWQFLIREPHNNIDVALIVPNIPELSFSVNCINIDNNATVLRGRHFHKEFEIFRIDDGVMQLNSGEENLELRSGDVAFINSFYIHEIKADLGMKANQNFTYQELLELAEEYESSGNQ